MRTKSGTQRLLRWIGNGLLVVMLVWTLVPFYWMVATSLKKDKEIYGFEATLVPRHPTLDAYRLLFAKTPFVKYVQELDHHRGGNDRRLARLRLPGRLRARPAPLPRAGRRSPAAWSSPTWCRRRSSSFRCSP